MPMSLTTRLVMKGQHQHLSSTSLQQAADRSHAQTGGPPIHTYKPSPIAASILPYTVHIKYYMVSVHICEPIASIHVYKPSPMASIHPSFHIIDIYMALLGQGVRLIVTGETFTGH